MQDISRRSLRIVWQSLENPKGQNPINHGTRSRAAVQFNLKEMSLKFVLEWLSRNQQSEMNYAANLKVLEERQRIGPIQKRITVQLYEIGLLIHSHNTSGTRHIEPRDRIF